MTIEESLQILDDWKRSLGIIPGKEWYKNEMARKKITAEERFAEAVREIGIEKSQVLLNFLKNYEDKKSPGTDPDPKARKRRPHITEGGINDKPTE